VRVQRLESDLSAGTVELEALRTERERTVAELRRVAASRAWRWGHGLAKLLRRLTFRRSVRESGAIDTMIGYLEAPPVQPATTKSPEVEPP
jgi:hypothetical protein